MIISQTPHRISFFGGGTDYPSYYLKHGGCVLGAAIDKYCYLTVRKLPPFFTHKHRIVYSNIENVSNIDEIDHPSVRAVLKYLKIPYGVSIHHDGDIPARSGMGSSSAFTTGLLKSMFALEGKHISQSELAQKAIYIEQKLIGENVGSQDQVFAAYGGLNIIDFLQNGEIKVHPLIMSASRMREFESSLVLIFTGCSRIASEIAGEQIKNTHLNIDKLDKMKELVKKACSILSNNKKELGEFGELLNETWHLKKKLSNKITQPEIDDLYEKAIKAGATGGKLLGAGGGGFMLFFVEPEKQRKFKKILKDYLEVPFKFDFEGSKIIVYQPDND